MARVIVGVLAALLVVGVLVGGFVAWRLSNGPIRLDFLTRRLESALSATGGSTSVRIGSTSLEFDARNRDFDVRIHDLRVHGPGGVPLATVPVLAVGIDPFGLLRGVTAPRTLEVIAPRIRLVRGSDGRIDVGLGHGPAPETTRLLTGLPGGPRAGPGWAALRTILVREGEVVLDDQASSTSWQAQRVELTARRARDGVTIERLDFDLEPAHVLVTGRVAGRVADLELTLDRLPTPTVEGWWPAAIAPDLRRWVLANVSDGGVRTARVTLRCTRTETPHLGFAVSALGGQAVFDGLAVRWLEGMPLATGVAGRVVASATGWQIRLARGDLQGLDLVRAAVMPGPAAGDGLRIDASVRGPLSKALVLLDSPALRAGAGVPLRPGEISGGVTARVLVGVPPPPREGIDVRASGELRSVSLRRAFRGRNVNARRLRFDLDDREFEMRGEVTIGRTPLQLRWQDSLAGPSRGRRAIGVKGRLDAEGRGAFGVDLSPWLDGPVDAQARLTPRGKETTAVDVQVDLAPASLDLPLLHMLKGPGEAGSAQARLLVSGGAVRAVEGFALEVSGSSVEGKATLDAREAWQTVEGTATIAPRSLEDSPGRIAFQVRPAGIRSQLTVTSDDAGTFLRAIDAYADATGGSLKLIGDLRLGYPGTPLSGNVRIDRFTLTRSPMVAKIAALSSISGIIDALGGEGIPFTRLAATIAYRAGVITFSDGVTAGPAMALTMRGTVDRMRDDLALSGTLIPNYVGLNRLAAKLPVARELPTGLHGEGVQAFDFEASGSLSDPYVTVNPASAVAPSILRDLARFASQRIAGDIEPEVTSKGKLKPEATSKGKRKPGAQSKAKKANAKPKPKLRRGAPAAAARPETDTE